MYVCAFVRVIVRVCELLKETQWGEPLYSDDVKQFGAKRYHKLKLESFEGAVTLVVWTNCTSSALGMLLLLVVVFFFFIVLYKFYLFVC